VIFMGMKQKNWKKKSKMADPKEKLSNGCYYIKVELLQQLFDSRLCQARIRFKKDSLRIILKSFRTFRVPLIIPTAICNQERIMNGANTVHCKYFLQKKGYPVKHWQKPVAFSNYSL
jgi:hypothetical protein